MSSRGSLTTRRGHGFKDPVWQEADTAKDSLTTGRGRGLEGFFNDQERSWVQESTTAGS